MTLLKVRGLQQRFGGLVAVDGVDLDVPEAGIVSLIGPNGAGKTTFFNTIAGVYKPAGGTIEFDGTDLTGRPQHRIVQAGIARTFQNIRLFAQMSAMENVMVGTFCRTRAGVFRSLVSRRSSPEEAMVLRRSRELLERCEVPSSLFGRPAGHLSYGHQRRVEIARALSTEPRLLLLDEPTAGMNPSETRDFIGFLQSLSAEGLAVLLIEHDMRLVMTVSERVSVLDAGQKIAEGPPALVQQDPRVIEAYLGTEAHV